jgi:transcription initiation factor TFIIH subunit 4
MQADFDAAEKYAKDLNVLLWSNPKKRTMVIKEE